MLRRIAHELKHHAPFTLLGTVIGIGVLILIVYGRMDQEVSKRLFAVAHPTHVLFSAIATAGMFRKHSKAGWPVTLVVGIVGSIGIGTLSDSVIPYVGELLFAAGDVHVHAHAHIGFIELWWLVMPFAAIGAIVGHIWPKTEPSHAGHVMLSTAASLLHMTMAMSPGVGAGTIAAAAVFLFAAVWVPCCTSDIVFPLLLVPKEHWPACKRCKDASDDGA